MKRVNVIYTHPHKVTAYVCHIYSRFHFPHLLTHWKKHTYTHTKRLSPKVRLPACSCSHREIRCTASPLSFFIVCLWCPMCVHWLSFNPSQHTVTTHIYLHAWWRLLLSVFIFLMHKYCSFNLQSCVALQRLNWIEAFSSSCCSHIRSELRISVNKVLPLVKNGSKKWDN